MKSNLRLEIVEIIVSQDQLLLTVQAIRVTQQVFPQRDSVFKRARRFYHPVLKFQMVAGIRMPPEDSTVACDYELLCFYRRVL